MGAISRVMGTIVGDREYICGIYINGRFVPLSPSKEYPCILCPTVSLPKSLVDFLKRIPTSLEQELITQLICL